MLKFSASLFMFFNELPLLDRFQAVAKAGFKAVEYPFPYEFDKALLAEKLHQANLAQVLINSHQGDWHAGDRGLAVLPNRIGEFQDSIDLAIEYATALNCNQISVPAGIAPLGVDKEKIRDIYLENIKFAANKMKEKGIKLLVEAINTYDMPGFYISSSQHALDLIESTNNDNVWLLYDIYHMQRMEGEITQNIKKYLPHIAHIQIADNPNRHEPGSGELNFSYLFNLIDNIDYNGWVGCEYWPKGKTIDGLGWFNTYRYKD